MTVCSFASAVLLLALRFMLVRENKKRDSAPRDTKYDEVYITKTTDSGAEEEKKVDRVSASFHPLHSA